MEPDPTMVRIGQGIELAQRGERGAAREPFTAVWDDIGGERGDPMYRCAVAHSIADVQDNVNEELAWDLRALAAADLLTDERAAKACVVSPVAAFYPSLHLNLAECYHKLNDLDRARQHLRQGRAVIGAFPDDGYGRAIKRALDQLAERLTSA